MLFIVFFNANIRFAEKKFVWKNYITRKISFILKKFEPINRREIAIVVLNKNKETGSIYCYSIYSLCNGYYGAFKVYCTLSSDQ